MLTLNFFNFLSLVSLMHTYMLPQLILAFEPVRCDLYML
jgi:hypothetical protein